MNKKQIKNYKNAQIDIYKKQVLKIKKEIDTSRKEVLHLEIISLELDHDINNLKKIKTKSQIELNDKQIKINQKKIKLYQTVIDMTKISNNVNILIEKLDKISNIIELKIKKIKN